MVYTQMQISPPHGSVNSPLELLTRLLTGGCSQIPIIVGGPYSCIEELVDGANGGSRAAPNALTPYRKLPSGATSLDVGPYHCISREVFLSNQSNKFPFETSVAIPAQ
jgi:hypothetical protein